MIRTIKNLSQGENFNIEMKVTPIKKENETFEFSNSMFLLEKNLLKIMDAKENILHPDAIISIRPKKLDRVKTTISKKNPFIYNIKGVFINEEKFIRLKLASVEYLLKKGEKYFVELNNNDFTSNRVFFIL
ncbi:hypothetical protein CHU92_00095 [Flavobacterium cyanobacteriorum]|uniref:Uncharacterized protein n=1 Tax=Flavobacterium cyanobacteriorum TaxID=2022802 RepID=A0A256A9J4_9FLAO|nr:hypothetical protein [Flavobacterium cyanobacteriorum]OYQ50386.1 hypothetical protein CHU92_00095 [Flavobacterium cyanobacteriorum]